MHRPIKLFFAAVIIAALVLPIFSYAQKNDTFDLLSLFGDVFERVRSDYVERPNDAKLVDSAG